MVVGLPSIVVVDVDVDAFGAEPGLVFVSCCGGVAVSGKSTQVVTGGGGGVYPHISGGPVFDEKWQEFVFCNGAGVHARLLGLVTGVPEADVLRFRSVNGRAPGVRVGKRSFSQLFKLWHGRSPEPHEWPVPQFLPRRRAYEWLEPEVEYVASLVGAFGPSDIASMLTDRLRKLTGDPTASRTLNAVHCVVNRLGLVTGDVQGGVTISDAGRAIGSVSLVRNLVDTKRLPSFKVGRLQVIPHDAWRHFLETRAAVPEGYVKLASCRRALAIRSDKLAEFAGLGLVPGAIQVRLSGGGGESNRGGAWYIPADLAEKLIEDRHAGRKMPWSGGVYPANIKQVWKKWSDRRHSEKCISCRDIWGAAGAPQTFDDFSARYPSLSMFAKRHITRIEFEGITIAEAVKQVGVSRPLMEKAIADGRVASIQVPGGVRVLPESLANWHDNRRKNAFRAGDWMTVADACWTFGFEEDEIEVWIAGLRITTAVISGNRVVSRRDCVALREECGYTLKAAIACTKTRRREVISYLKQRGVDPNGTIPAFMVLEIKKRRLAGARKWVLAIDEAAKEIGVDVSWIERQVGEGAIVLSTPKQPGGLPTLGGGMIRRLRRIKETGESRAIRDVHRVGWERLSAAASYAGVTAATLLSWKKKGLVVAEKQPFGLIFELDAIKGPARSYWAQVRHIRLQPPQWLLDEGFIAKGQSRRT